METDAPSPGDRLRSDAVPAGTPVLLEGRAWHLAGCVPSPGPVWDRLVDQNILRGCYDLLDVQLAAHKLLLERYELSVDEGVALIRSADRAELRRAVESALFGEEKVHRTWSDWVVSSLAANGLRFEDVPADRLGAVMDLLVANRRTVPMSEFVSSAQYHGQRAAILHMANKGKK